MEMLSILQRRTSPDSSALLYLGLVDGPVAAATIKFDAVNRPAPRFIRWLILSSRRMDQNTGPAMHAIATANVIRPFTSVVVMVMSVRY